MKKFSDNIGNRTRDLPACSAVRQPTTPQRNGDVLHENMSIVWYLRFRVCDDVYSGGVSTNVAEETYPKIWDNLSSRFLRNVGKS